MSEEDEMEVSAPGGWKVKGRPFILLCILCIAGISFAGWKHETSNHDEHQKLRESFEEIAYIISLTPEEREKLNLAMPDSLRQRIRRRREE